MNEPLIWVLGGLLFCAAAALLLVLLRACRPLNRLAKLTAQLDELDAEDLSRRAETIPGKAGAVARTLAELVSADSTECGVPETDAEKEKAVYRQSVVDEICSSLLPQPLENRLASLTFALTGGILSGQRRNCAFYDYFFLDESTLCLTVGEVPGNSIAEALFAVVAQTTIRSQLRMGRSLVEAMSDCNAQLFDLGSRSTTKALVCVLNTMNGRFSYVNAGGTLPLLMRSEECYEWLQTPVYAPLGANERVSYRSEVLRLNQGDRLFLYTSDLGELTGSDGSRFLDREFQSVLNRSRSKTENTEELVGFVRDEAAAFCRSGDDVLSAGVIALEYKKGNRDYVFTLVRAVPEEAPLVTEFIRKTLQDAGIPSKESARHILLAEELFAVCCRSCPQDTDIKLECAIKPGENALHLRMFAPMGGENPLNNRESDVVSTAAGYISSHTNRTAFESGIDRDMVEIVTALS